MGLMPTKWPQGMNKKNLSESDVCDTFSRMDPLHRAFPPRDTLKAILVQSLKGGRP